MMNMKRIGLVIQGPLTSIGRTGDNLRKSPEQLLREGGVVHYDCRPNIRRIISEFGHFFDEIVVSTWESEVREGDSFPGARLVAAPDPGGIKQENHYKDNNKFRQFLSTLNGILELEKSGIGRAVKVRTDIYLDLKALLDSFASGMEKEADERLIYATVSNPPTFLLHDLYFAASLPALKDFCESVLAYERFEFIPSVHREMILKHAYFTYKEQIGVPDWAYFPFSPPAGACSETAAIFEYMFANIYRTLDTGIFRSTLWRGTYFEEKHVSALIEKKDQKAKKRHLPGIMTTDWKRYYAFREQIGGFPASTIEKIKAVAGELMWNAWNKSREIGRKALNR
jgi:hypothetical protein